jgi:hypothetical protein
MAILFKDLELQLLDAQSIVPCADVNAIKYIIQGIKSIHVNLIKFKDLEEILTYKQIKCA